MLDTVGAGGERLPIRCERVGVGEQPQAGLVGSLDGRAQLVSVNCTPKTSEPVVSMPPLAISLTTSTPRSACAATIARRPSTPAAAPPR